MPMGSLSFASLLCNMSQDNKCRSLNCFSDTELIQLMLLQMLNAQVPAVFGSLMSFKSMKCGDTRAKAAFPGNGFLAGEGRDWRIRKRALGRWQETGSLILILHIV